jgi:hypothetical protein
VSCPALVLPLSHAHTVITYTTNKM